MSVPRFIIISRTSTTWYERSELDYLIYNDPIGYADMILNGDPEAYLRQVTDYHPLDT